MYYIAQTVFTANDLTHYGVPGMRWGHKNTNSSIMTPEQRSAQRKQLIKTAAKVAGATALAGAAAYGAYKVGKNVKAKKLSSSKVSDYYNKKNHVNMSKYYSKKANLADSSEAYKRVRTRAQLNGHSIKERGNRAYDMLKSDAMAYDSYSKQAMVNPGLTKSRNKWNYSSKNTYSSNNYRNRAKNNIAENPYSHIIKNKNGTIIYSQKAYADLKKYKFIK